MKIRRLIDTGEWTTRRYLSLLGNILIWAVVAIDGWYMWPTQLGGDSAFVVVSGHSMEPTFFGGDLVIARKMEPSVGDVIVYAPESLGGSQIVHRIIGGNATDGWKMQGDNNNFVDPFTPKGSEVKGVVLVHYANFGRVTVLLLNPIVWALVLLAAMVLLLWYTGDDCEERHDDDENKGNGKGEGDPEPETEEEPDLIDRMVEGTEAALARMVGASADAGAAVLAALTRPSPAPRHAAAAPRQAAPALLRGFAIVAVLGLLAIYGPSTASASQLIVNAGNQAFVTTLTKCDTLNLTATTDGGHSPGHNNRYTQVRIFGVTSACAGKPITVSVYTSNGGFSETVQTESTVGPQTFDIPEYRSTRVDMVVVKIDGWLFLATWSTTPPPPPISAYRLQSFNYRDHFVRHTGIDNQAIIEGNADQLVASEFRVVDGLAPGGGTRVSFESVDNPGYYLRRLGNELVLDDAGGSFAQDATFIQVAGLADGQWWSFQSVSNSNLYIRHQNFYMWLDDVGAGGFTQLELEDTTFRFIVVG